MAEFRHQQRPSAIAAFFKTAIEYRHRLDKSVRSRPVCMDAIVAARQSARTQPSLSASLPLLLALCVLASGCAGKSLVDDNPVFAAAPPRGSYENKASLASNDPKSDSAIQAVGFSTPATTELTGNTIIAEVNGNPIFVDDLVGSMRLTIEADSRITPEQRQQILQTQIKARLDSYLEQEIVLAALNKAVPADRQEIINSSLEEPFQQVLANIKADRKIQTDAELDKVLAGEGLSIDLLRESFVRIQKVQGFLSTMAETPSRIERPELVKYYQTHTDEFATDERVRWQEVVIRFDKHGGREAAEKVMADVISQLQNGADFAQLATKQSDALSAEKRGDMGWLQRGNLADKVLEARLFELQTGEMTKVYVRADQFEVYRVADHQQKHVAPLQEVQSEIEQKIRQQAQKDAREKALNELRETATVVTIFDDEEPSKQ